MTVNTATVTALIIGLGLLTACQTDWSGSGRGERPRLQTSLDLYAAFDGDIANALRCARDTATVIVVAHRGGFAPGYPENSAAAIERTMRSIPAILELDIRHSVDGVDFLHHDEALEPTIALQGLAEQTAWSAIAVARLRDNSRRIVSERPVSFEQLLEAHGGRAFLMLDLKAPADTSALVRTVRDANLIEGTIFIAYDVEQALAIRAVDSSAVVAMSVDNLAALARRRYDTTKAAASVALTGALTRDQTLYAAQRSIGHFVLAGGHLGDDPPDAAVGTGRDAAILDSALAGDVQLVVSNRPLLMHRHLKASGKTLRLSDCRQPER